MNAKRVVLILSALGIALGALSFAVPHGGGGDTTAAGAKKGADKPIELGWPDLIPKSADSKMSGGGSGLKGVVTHWNAVMVARKLAKGLVTDYNDKLVRIPGYIVPLDFDGKATKEFLIVPYVGACIHVPAPPANQIVYVTSEKPVKISEYFEPVYVIGKFVAKPQATNLAKVGYRIEAVRVEPYK